MEGILLFSHGSLLCGAGLALDRHAARLRESGKFPLVEIGYLNYSEPTFETGVRRLAEAGADLITITPYFLVPGYFVTTSLPKMLSGVKDKFPGVEFIVADALGTDELLENALIESAKGAVQIKAGTRDQYATSASECRLRSDCPLYETTYCPNSRKVFDSEASSAVYSEASTVIPSVVEGAPILL